MGSWGREREERINEETVDGASTTGAGKKTQESQRRAWRQLSETMDSRVGM